MRLNPTGDLSDFPKRADLPAVPGTPEGSAWFWGDSDDLGRLNLLTPQRTLKAAQENIKTGDVVSLNLPLDVPGPAFLGRKSLCHEIKSIGLGAFDDDIAINTQSSSQWDGFRHFSTTSHYNGVTSSEILGEGDHTGKFTSRSPRLGIDAWAKKGIVGRGVLLDIYTWSQSYSQPYDPFTRHAITAVDLAACAKAQGITFHVGDILLVRTGWIATYLSLTPTQKHECAHWEMERHVYAGLEASHAVKDFLHDSYFAAAASDNISFEVWPPESNETSLHASMLPLWGMPIGELWDLEGLSEKCKELGRWTFLVTSAPVNVPGGVGSPPNALALF
jgi:hypothetical protein